MKNILFYILLLSVSLSSAQTVLIKEKKGKFGATDMTGKNIIPCKYDSVAEIKIKNTVCIKAWSKGQFAVFNLLGKGDDKNKISDFVPVSVFPNKEYILTQSGGIWIRTALGENEYSKNVFLKVPDSITGYATWQKGKRGIYDFKNGNWVLKPEYDDIIFPIEGTITSDSVVPETTGKNKSVAYYWTMNVAGEAEVKFNKLSDFPLITVQNKKFELTNWDGTKLLKGITYDSIFYTPASNCFYGISANGISCMDISGNLIKTGFKYTQVTGSKDFVLIADSATMKIEESNPASYVTRIIRSNSGDTNRLFKINYGFYDKTINLRTNRMGIYDRARNKIVIAPQYVSFYFYYRVLKKNYEYIAPVVQEDKKVEYADTLVWDPVVQRYLTEKGKRVIDKRFGYYDNVYFKKVEELTPVKMVYTVNYLESVNLHFPFWGIKENKEYDLLDTTGKKISEGNITEFRYVAVNHDKEFYMLKNSNGTFSLIDIYGKNALKEKEYFLIEEKEKGFNVQKEKTAKTEFVKFPE